MDYKSYLIDWIEKHGRTGLRKKMANHLRCQPSFITQVLSGSCHLSLEQADSLSQWLGHTELEAEYFLTLVQYGRAGTPSLRQRFERVLNALKERLVLERADRREVGFTLPGDSPRQ